MPTPSSRCARRRAASPTAISRSLPIATETAAALFLAGTFAGASARLIGLTWGAEDLSAELGAQANRDAEGRFLDPYRLARALCIAGAAAARVPAIDTVYVDFRNTDGLPPRMRGGLPRRLYRQDGDPSGAGADHQRGVHAFGEARRACARGDRRVRRRPGAGVVGIGGVMYDRPHLVRAKQLLARAERHT